MTANEWSDEFDVVWDSLYSNTSPGFDDTRKSILFTLAQKQFIDSIFTPENNRRNKAFEEDEIRSQGLSQLIVDSNDINSDGTVVSSDQSGAMLNGTLYDLPSDFMYATLEEVLTNIPDCLTSTETQNNYTWIPVFPVTQNEITRNRYNNFRKPYCVGYEGLVWRANYSRKISDINPAISETRKRHELITDGTFTISKYHVRYIKNPQDIIVDLTTPLNQRNCELDKGVHHAIIRIAVDLAYQAITGQKTIIGINDLA